MLKEVLASNVAKLVAACVCPVVGASAVALKVPQVRAAVHKATEPKSAQAKPKTKKPPEREARAKPRVRAPIRPAIAPEVEDGGEQLAQGMMCPSPVQLGGDMPLGAGSSQQTVMMAPPPAQVVEVQQQLSVSCPSVGGGMVVMPDPGVGGAVPEPATWAQMIAGFALAGATVRAGRRRARRAVA